MSIRSFFSGFCFVFLFSTLSTAQGIQFEKLPNWKAVKQLAKSKGKPIFVDAYTTWCGPCILMSKNVFTDPEAGAFFNENFISIKIQLDTTSRDNAFVKGWYSDAARLAREYKINAYPTLLFFDAEGNILHKIIGYQSAEQLVTKAKHANDPTRQYYGLLRRYQSGNMPPEFLKFWIVAARNAYDMENAERATYDYLKTQSSWLTHENAELLAGVTHSSSDTGFALMSNYPHFFNSDNKTPLFAQEKVRGIIQKEFINPILFPNNAPVAKEPLWDTLFAQVRQKFPEQGAMAFWLSKAFYHEITGDKAAWLATITRMVSTYPGQWPANWLNQQAWTVFESWEEMSALEQAIAWAQAAVQQDEDPLYIDTLAQLLYKVGKSDEAIQWMEKAVTLLKAAKEDPEEYEETLQKMKQGEKIG